mgnify:CR=1 FL=1
MEINKLKILYDAIRPAEEPTIENPTKEDVASMLNFAVHYMEDGLDGVLDAMKKYAELHVQEALYQVEECGDIRVFTYPESNIE